MQRCIIRSAMSRKTAGDRARVPGRQSGPKSVIVTSGCSRGDVRWPKHLLRAQLAWSANLSRARTAAQSSLLATRRVRLTIVPTVGRIIHRVPVHSVVAAWSSGSWLAQLLAAMALDVIHNDEVAQRSCGGRVRSLGGLKRRPVRCQRMCAGMAAQCPMDGGEGGRGGCLR